MTFLIMGDEVKARAREIAEFAARPENLFRADCGWVPGDRPEFVLKSGDVKAVFTHSEGEGGKVLRHMSISVPRRGKLPSELVVYTVAGYFGFTGGTTGGSGPDVLTAPGPDWGIFVNEIENTLVVLQPVDG